MSNVASDFDLAHADDGVERQKALAHELLLRLLVVGEWGCVVR